nr:uncharacterized protein LOC110362310 isoform X11 [Columba livia]XP_021149713.1 uncharacterized protein LOC110362310 isoform X11 [Columba livia]XP_021149714.1 uncharacterized protein LOC110362310 isoform X11 [Columba livia]XP_021149715.1 uncharacterized protein LOC110362310 isoform X11 [Columba livia]XP_021149716.1 uncharacterized protein LOC110362310 isoform X11 [Columba livia]
MELCTGNPGRGFCCIFGFVLVFGGISSASSNGKDDCTCVLRPGGSWMHETVCSVFPDLGSKLTYLLVAEELSSLLPHSARVNWCVQPSLEETCSSTLLHVVFCQWRCGGRYTMVSDCHG